MATDKCYLLHDINKKNNCLQKLSNVLNVDPCSNDHSQIKNDAHWYQKKFKCVT